MLNVLTGKARWAAAARYAVIGCQENGAVCGQRLIYVPAPRRWFHHASRVAHHASALCAWPWRIIHRASRGCTHHAPRIRARKPNIPCRRTRSRSAAPAKVCTTHHPQRIAIPPNPHYRYFRSALVVPGITHHAPSLMHPKLRSSSQTAVFAYEILVPPARARSTHFDARIRMWCVAGATRLNPKSPSSPLTA